MVKLKLYEDTGFTMDMTDHNLPQFEQKKVVGRLLANVDCKICFGKGARGHRVHAKSKEKTPILCRCLKITALDIKWVKL